MLTSSIYAQLVKWHAPLQKTGVLYPGVRERQKIFTTQIDCPYMRKTDQHRLNLASTAKKVELGMNGETFTVASSAGQKQEERPPAS